MAASAALRAALAVGFAAAVAAAGYFATRSAPPEAAAPEAARPDPAGPDATLSEPDAAASAPGLEAPANFSTTPMTPVGPPPETAAAARVPEVPAVAEPVPTVPTFDVVRVQPDGGAVVAGQAEAGATITIYADNAPVAEVEADAEGGFVAIFSAGRSEAPRALTLDAETSEGAITGSDDIVVLLPAAPEEPAPEQTPAPDKADAKETEAAPEAGDADAVAATVILRQAGAEVGLTGASDAKVRDVTLASIAYAEAGKITLAGLGTAGSKVRAYVDGRFARDGTVDPSGRWTIEIGEVDAGLYRLRIDQLRPDGTVASRVETPFQRDFPAPPAPDAAAARQIAVTVQPGNNLWTLAREYYGEGVRYTQIFTANRALIRDPDLIYPGQIFLLPEPATAGEPGPAPRPQAVAGE